MKYNSKSATSLKNTMSNLNRKDVAIERAACKGWRQNHWNSIYNTTADVEYWSQLFRLRNVTRIKQTPSQHTFKHTFLFVSIHLLMWCSAGSKTTTLTSSWIFIKPLRVPLERFMPLERNISELGEKLYYYLFSKKSWEDPRNVEQRDGKRRLNDAAINSVGELRQKKLRKQELTWAKRTEKAIQNAQFHISINKSGKRNEKKQPRPFHSQVEGISHT